MDTVSEFESREIPEEAFFSVRDNLPLNTFAGVITLKLLVTAAFIPLKAVLEFQVY